MIRTIDRVGPALAWLALTCGPGALQAAEGGATESATPTHSHNSSASADPAGSSTAILPQALPDLTTAPARPRVLDPAPSMAVVGPGLADFERIALRRNPTLKQAAAQVDAARSRAFQAGLYPNPIFSYIQEQIGALGATKPTSQGFVASGRPSPGDLVGGSVQQEIITGGKLRLSRAKFTEEATAAQWQAAAQELRVLNDVRIRYFEVLAARRLIDVARELVRINDDAVRTTEQLVNVGQANLPDLLQARLEARRARVALENAQKNYCGSWENLVSLVGAPELRPVPLDDRLLEVAAPPMAFDATLAHLLRYSPEVQVALSEIRRDMIMVRRERVEPIPNVTAQAIVGHNYEFNITTAGVVVNVPLPVFNRNQGTVREAMADLARDRAEYERIALSLRQRLADAFTRYENAGKSVREFGTRDMRSTEVIAEKGLGPEAGVLQLARRAYEVQLENFRARRSAWPQVLVAQRTFFELSQEYIQSLLEQRRVEVTIRGMLLVDGLAAPGMPTSQGHIESVPQPR